MSVTETERPEQFWVDALPKHVVDAMNGKDVEARFRDRADGPWTCVRKFKGWSKFNADDWFHDGSRAWNFCQVYEPESWWLNRPDPGPGYVLLKKLPDEPVTVGVEVFEGGEWHPSRRPVGDSQDRTSWYRRRIEPAPKFSVGQMVRVVGPKQRPARNWTAAMDEYIEQVYTVISVQNYPGHPSGTADFYSVKGVVDWAFREDYIEPVESEPRSILTDWECREGDTYRHPNGLQLKVTEKGFEVF
jgi:hypothetical protein